MDLVLLAQNDLRRVEGVVALERRPLNPDLWIVPHDSAFIGRAVNVVAFVAELRLVREHEKAVGKASGNEELPRVFRRKDDALPFAIRRASGAKVNRHVESFPFDHTYKLRLRMLYLEMQAPQHALDRSGMVILHEIARNTARFEVGLYTFP